MKKFTKLVRRIRTSRFQTKAGVALITIGVIVGGASLYNLWQSQRSVTSPKPWSQVLSDKKPADNGIPTISGTPTHITIPSVNIDLNVIPGYYSPKSQSWTLSLDSAQYAVMTPKVNDKSGATFIYGHYRLHVFYTLPKIQPGDLAVITADNGHTFTYTFVSSTITTPDNTELFNYKGKPVLILQTCTGVHFQNRQLFVFDLTKVS